MPVPRLELDDPALERTLRDLGRSLAYAPPEDLRRLVLARIAAAPAPALSWWDRVASPRHGLRPALAALATLLLAAALAVPGVRAAAAEILRFGGIEIFRVPAATAPASLRPTPGPSATPAFGTAVTIEVARARAGYPIAVPTDGTLGPPDDVFLRPLRDGALGVTLVYRQRPGIPASPFAGVSAMVSYLPGTFERGFLGKVAGPGTAVELVTVNGGDGAWLSGQPHQLFYRTGAQTESDELRLAGNTLVWQQGPTTIRIEAAIDRAAALRIAGTMRP
jgi:hypothetical protein